MEEGACGVESGLVEKSAKCRSADLQTPGESSPIHAESPRDFGLAVAIIRKKRSHNPSNSVLGHFTDLDSIHLPGFGHENITEDRIGADDWAPEEGAVKRKRRSNSIEAHWRSEVRAKG